MMRAVILGAIFATSCGWGPEFFDCAVDVDQARLLAVRNGVVDVFDRMDFFCEPRADVMIDCRNDTAEACTLWLGSTFARGRSFYSSEATEGMLPLIHHEVVAHWVTVVDNDDPCAQHPPDCR